jgi:hypothetical protein
MSDTVSSWGIVAFSFLINLPSLLMIIWWGGGKKRWENRNRKPVGEGMAKKRSTWEIEYGAGPNPDRLSGYNSTTTARIIAATHDEAVALLKEYDPNFDPQHIVKSQRGMIEYIVGEGTDSKEGQY